jgi:iron complex transport system substrate-binding protein
MTSRESRETHAEPRAHEVVGAVAAQRRAEGRVEDDRPCGEKHHAAIGAELVPPITLVARGAEELGEHGEPVEHAAAKRGRPRPLHEKAVGVALAHGADARVDVERERPGQLGAGEQHQPEVDTLAPDGSRGEGELHEGQYSKRRKTGSCLGVEEAVLHADGEVAVRGVVLRAAEAHQRLTLQPQLEALRQPDPQGGLDREPVLGGPVGRLLVFEAGLELHGADGNGLRAVGDAGPIGLDLVLGARRGGEQEAERERQNEPGHRRRDAITVLLGLILMLAGVGPAAAVTYVDMLGRDVVLAAPPARIISLVPSVTELIFALGAEDRLVGVTDYCDFPPEARRKPSVGGMVGPSLETIVVLRPDLVVATDSGNRQETFGQLDRLGIPVYLVRANRFGEVLEVASRIGELTGRASAAAALTASLRGRVEAVARAVSRRPRPRVLYVLWPEPLIVPGRDAIVTGLIRLAGGTSITASEPSDYPRFSIEAAVVRAPEVIVLARHGTGTGPLARDKWDALTELPAVKAGRVYAVDGNLMHRYGPRVVDGLEHLARLLHPEAFR